MKFPRIEIATRIERNRAMSLLRKTILGGEGWIVHHQLFSNISTTLNFEIPLGSAVSFVDSLKTKGFNPIIEGNLPSGESGELRGSLSVTFIHDDPDLKRDVPAFG